jgi:hypothetical protein
LDYLELVTELQEEAHQWGITLQEDRQVIIPANRIFLKLILGQYLNFFALLKHFILRLDNRRIPGKEQIGNAL